MNTPNEHVRYAAYLRELESVVPPADLEVVGRVLRDPDKVMADSAVARHVDRAAESIPDFEAWAAAMLPVVAGRAFLVRRIGEWRTYRTIMNGGAPDRERLREASDWLQRKLAASIAAGSVLEMLAEVGRTKRVRNAASAKLSQGL